MTWRRPHLPAGRLQTVAALAFLLLPALAGCTWDSGTETRVTLLLTEDHGTTPIAEHVVDVQVNWTVVDALHEVADLETAYGGGFVVSVDGHPAEGSDKNWFFEVDGVQSDAGAAERHLHGGEVVHWDLRAWIAPGVPPGLWNSFPADAATHLRHGSLPTGTGPGDSTTWADSWPDGPAVLHVPADDAPWPEIHGATRDGDTLHVGGDALTPPWALAVRMGPPGTARGVMVYHGLDPGLDRDREGALPEAGYGLAYTPEDQYHVIP